MSQAQVLADVAAYVAELQALRAQLKAHAPTSEAECRRLRHVRDECERVRRCALRKLLDGLAAGVRDGSLGLDEFEALSAAVDIYLPHGTVQ